MNQKLSDWASIAEITGAVAIVISLIYVGVQVNDSTRAVRSATANETSAAISSWYLTVGGDPQASRVMRMGMTDPESLSEDEMLQFIYQLHGVMLQWQTAFYLSEEGTLDTELMESVTNTLIGANELPGIREYWEQRGSLFKQSFRDYVEEIMSSDADNSNFMRAYPTEVPE